MTSYSQFGNCDANLNTVSSDRFSPQKKVFHLRIMNIQVSNQQGTVVLTISRPEAMNALNQQVLQDLEKVIQPLFQDASVKGIIITGAGDKAFIAGADIKELAALSHDEALRLSKWGQQLFSSIEHAPKPVIAAVDGFALGGGCELAMACHMRIATENSKFGQPEVNLAIIPGYGATQRLTQLVGRGKALELMLTGDMITAQEAKTLGLVNHVVSNKQELMALATKIIDKIAGKGPVAVAKVIDTINSGFGYENRGYEAEAKNFAACASTADFKEGTSAFIEKRKAQFKGA
jgi:enoyl-CoA hydratase